MADVFVSYAREDRDRVAPLVGLIESRGWTVWWDRHIEVGRSYHETIEEQLNAARCVVVFWTGFSVRSQWVLNEAEEGKGRGVLVPVKAGDVRPPLAFRHLQTADLTGWDGGDHPAVDDCLRSIARIAGTPAEKEPAPSPEPPPATVRRRRRWRLAIAGAVAFLIVVTTLVLLPDHPTRKWQDIPVIVDGRPVGTDSGAEATNITESAAEIDGLYRRDREGAGAEVEVRRLPNGRAKVNGTALWGETGPYGPHTGTLAFEEAVDGNVILHREDEGYQIRLSFDGDRLHIEEEGASGRHGMNVTFRGEYSRVP